MLRMWRVCARRATVDSASDRPEAIGARSPRSITPHRNARLRPATERDGRNREPRFRPRSARLARPSREPGDRSRRARVDARRATAPTRERIDALLAYLGSPQLEYPAVHLTGTNGKTSTARMVTQLARRRRSVGRFVHEPAPRTGQRAHRVPRRADRRRRARRAAAHGRASWRTRSTSTRRTSKCSTAAAFRWFADLAIDVAVVEVGLGGTWDATNWLETRVAVITNVAIDHVAYLGPTRAQIAAEKAGIVQPDSTLVLGETDPGLARLLPRPRHPRDVLRRDVDFGVRENVLAVGGRLIDLYTPTRAYEDVLLPLHGAHQADNAALALMAAEAFLGAPLDPRGGRRRVRDGARRRAGSRSCAGSRSSCSTARTTSPARKRCAPRSTRSSRPGRARWSSGSCARRIRTRCCARWASTKSPSWCAARRRAGGRSIPSSIAAAARDLGLPDEQIEVAESVERGRDDRAAADARRRPGRRHRLALRRRRGPIAPRPTLTRECARDGRAAHRRHRGQRHRAGAPLVVARDPSGHVRVPCATSTRRAPRRPASDFDVPAFTDLAGDVRERNDRRGRRRDARGNARRDRACAALDAGMHVYCEKPIAPTADEGYALGAPRARSATHVPGRLPVPLPQGLRRAASTRPQRSRR